MMTRGSLVLVLLLLLSSVAHSMSIETLFNALKKQPLTKIDKIIEKSASIARNKTISSLYPKVYGTASYEHFSSPTSLIPVTPTESAQLIRTGGALPFSNNIEQLGVTFEMPLIVVPIFKLVKKAQEIKMSAEERKKLNLIKNEAAIVTLNARLKYTESLIRATAARISSLKSSLNIIERGIKIGRIPGIEALKINNKIDQLKILMNKLKVSRKLIIASIEKLTSIKLSHSIHMRQVSKIREGAFFSLKPLEYTLRAQKYNVEAKESELYPSIYLKGFAFRKFGKSYNTDEPVVKNYAGIGIYLQVPIFNKTTYTDIQKAQASYIKSKLQLQQLKIDLRAESESLNRELRLLDSSLKLARLSVRNQVKLLKYAKVAFKIQRMTEEEYLRYEDNLLGAQADLYNLEAKKWEVISKLAVIYGNNLEDIVK